LGRLFRRLLGNRAIDSVTRQRRRQHGNADDDPHPGIAIHGVASAATSTRITEIATSGTVPLVEPNGAMIARLWFKRAVTVLTAYVAPGGESGGPVRTSVSPIMSSGTPPAFVK